MVHQRTMPFDPKTFPAGVGSGKTILGFERNQTIFSQGEAADAVFYIQQGRVKISVVSSRGKEAVLSVLERADFFGEGCLLAGQSIRSASATSMEDSTIVRIEKDAMIRVLHDEPTFSERFMSHLLSRNTRIEEDLVDQLLNFSEKRLARILLLLAHFGEESMTEPIIPKISQETLAEMVGTTRSRVSFFLTKFRKLGMIDYSGGLRIHDSLVNILAND